MNLKQLYILILVIYTSTLTFSQNFWEIIPSPTTNILRTLHFSDSLRGWVAGDSGVVFYTYDGGITWTQQPTNTTSKIVRLFFLDDKKGWGLAWAENISDTNLFFGTEILKTTNGGESWNVEQYIEEGIFLRGIHFLDSLNGFAGGQPNKFLVTSDGGINWEPANIDSGTFSQFPVIDYTFFNNTYGFACGGRFDIAGVIWKTTNAGNNWTPIDPQYSPADEVWDIHFFDSLNVMGIGGDPDQFGVGIIRSTDAGESWNYFEIGVFGQAQSISFRTANEGWAVVPLSESLVATFDLGNTWGLFLAPDSSKLYDIQFTDSLIGYAVGEGGRIVKFAYRPIIKDVQRSPGHVGINIPVSVTAEIKDLDGFIIEAKLYYRKNLGSYNELSMTYLGNNIWQTTIPAQSDSTIVDFFIRAKDDRSYISLSPKDTSNSRYFYFSLDRQLTIQDIQYNPFGSGDSGYDGYEVTVRGIVTTDTTDIQGDGIYTGPAVYIQNGSNHWSGIRISGEEAFLRKRGDDISVTGIVEEISYVTQIIGIDLPSDLTIHSELNLLPEPVSLSTGSINFLSNGSQQAEQWESVVIEYNELLVVDDNADGDSIYNNFGEILVADTISSVSTRIKLKDGTHHFHNFWEAGMDTIPGLIRIKTGDYISNLRGVLFFSFGNYKLIPRKDDDIDLIVSTEEEIFLPKDYIVSQNYPNPFNPFTKIDFTIPFESIVSLKIFNVLGEELITIINNENLIAGKYIAEIDGSNLSSGIYFYRFQANDFVRVKKMILLK